MLQKNTTHVLEQMRKTGPKKRGKGSVCNISSEIFTKQTPKNINKSENASDSKEGGSKDTLRLYCLDAYSRSASREMWIQCIQCQLWAHEKCTDSSPTFICSNCQSDGSEYFRLKMNACGCMLLLLLHCVSFASNFPFQFK